MSLPLISLNYSSKFIATVNDDKSFVATAFEFCPSIQILTVTHSISVMLSEAKASSAIDTWLLSTLPANMAVSVEAIEFVLSAGYASPPLAHLNIVAVEL